MNVFLEEDGARDYLHEYGRFDRRRHCTVRLPPLRERAEDVHPLVIHFLEHYKQRTGRFVSGISKDALRALISYEWPGNVRQLQNLGRR